MTERDDPRSHLPSVTDVLADPAVAAKVARHGHDLVVRAVRSALEAVRTRPEDCLTSPAPTIAAAVLETMSQQERMRLRPVVNATGVLLHTNLGRAALSTEAVAAMVAATGTTNLEYDLTTGRRGGRGAAAEQLLAAASDAPSGLLVNNGAAALILVMAAVVGARDVIVSRGELVEIGGSFRLPEILTAAGVRLVEVGTTNRTHRSDYVDAIQASTGAILRVHPSNYRMEGFVARPSARELARLAQRADIPFVHDVGSGLLRQSDAGALGGEPAVDQALRAGADLVVFSGDKLLGGPQAGAIVGRVDLVALCRKHPLARAVRVDKARLAALEATLAAHARGDLTALPTWRFLRTDPGSLRDRAERIALHLAADVVPTAAVVGGGSLPEVTLESWGVRLPGAPDRLARRLRSREPAVIGRISDGHLVLDLRAVDPQDDDLLIAAALGALDRVAPGGVSP